ncbi:hypothetical protein DL93DRAFT_2227915 [Clavulina sp. PMI_390]|nr:hypothetical protein DL93DRAFT_2227915 [Clavulina sp. PMI_390]
MSTVHQMHILSGDLTLHKRTLAPIRVLIYGLRRYDLDRVKALVSSSDPSADPEKAKGYLSHQSKVYLADVNDHMDYILESMDMFGTISENLISYTFNSISYQTNEAMRRLSLATIIFFPLTFLTGYFGMNFHRFSATNMSDAFFWAIGIPLVFVFVLVWSWSDLSRIAHVIKKQTAEKQYQQARSFVAIAQPQESNPHMPASDVASLCA